MSEIRLKPCPICGKSVTEITNAQMLENCANFDLEDCPCKQFEYAEYAEYAEPCAYYAVVCDYSKGGCGCTGGFRITSEEAAEAWNRRVGEQNE